MRKSLILMLIATLLVGAMLVSCNSDAAGNSSSGNKLAKVVISDNSNSKGIEAISENSKDLDTLYWFYKANKTDSSVYRTGDTGDSWKPVKTEDETHVKGLKGADLGYFSEGTWSFSFKGFVSPSIEGSAVYYTDAIAVTVSESTINPSDEKVHVTVTLSGGSGLLDSLVEFTGINWKYSSDNSTAYSTPTLDLLKTKTPTIKVYYRAQGSSGEWTLLTSATADAAVNNNGEATFSTFAKNSNDNTVIRIPSSINGINYEFKFDVFVVDNSADILVGTSSVASATAYKGGTITFAKTSADSAAIDDNESQFSVVVSETVNYPTN